MKRVTILLALVVLLGACKKKNDDNDNVSTGPSSILKTGSWRLSASTSVIENPAPVGNQTVDLYAMAPACETDNTFKYNNDNSITVDEGPTKCSASDPQTETGGTWTLSNNDTKFDLSYQGTNLSGDVVTINNSTFVLKYVTYFGGVKSTTTSIYVRP